jgi:flagellum-specific ATP synthase
VSKTKRISPLSSSSLNGLAAHIDALSPIRAVGRVVGVGAGIIRVAGLAGQAKLGERMRISPEAGSEIFGEVVQLQADMLIVLPDGSGHGVALQDRAILLPAVSIAPSDAWIGRVINSQGRPLDGRSLLRGPVARGLHATPPLAAKRRTLGKRLNTGMAVTNTILPMVTGQRMGLFAGSGVGKSSLLGQMAKQMEADVIVIALIGERGRELRHFLDDVIGKKDLQRTVVVAATSDQSPLQRRQCAWTAMAVAEHFRDAGRSVLLLADSITRFAEAHREVAVAAGEAPVLRGYPPSTAPEIMALCERAGPGEDGQGDITAIFSVLVAGSDMDEPVADILRGVLDGHIVLDREIAERGRYPAIDVLRSVSRSLPNAANEKENTLIARVRHLLGQYEQNAMMIRAGLYASGSDPEVDQAIALWPELDAFFARIETLDTTHSFQQLELLLRRNGGMPMPTATRVTKNGA